MLTPSSQAKKFRQNHSPSHHPVSASPTITCPYFLRGNCQYGQRCRQSHTPDLQAVRPTRPSSNFSASLNHTTDVPGRLTQNTSLPVPGREPDIINQNSFSGECIYYAQGRCTKGDLCPFRHTSSRAAFTTQSIAFGDCKFYAQGTCMNGDACSFRHTHKLEKDRNCVQNTLRPTSDQTGTSVGGSVFTRNYFNDSGTNPAAPPVQTTLPSVNLALVPCKFFNQGNCTKSDVCPFLHPSADPQRSKRCIPDTSSSFEIFGSTPRSCKYFGRGICTRGDQCAFSHELTDNKPSQTPSTYMSPSNGEEVLHNLALIPDSEVTEHAESIAAHTEARLKPTVDTERLMFRCTVKFGAGATVHQIFTAFESQHVVMSNFPMGVTEADIIDLVAPFGDLVNVVLDRPTLTAPRNATLKFVDAASAGRTVQNLNNAEFRSMMLAARLDLRAGLRAIETGAGILLSRKVKVTWYAPSIIAWAHFQSISTAKKQATFLDGKTVDGRKIVASLQRPRRGQIESFSVEIKGLPPGSTRATIQKLCPSASSVSLGEVSYDQKSSIQDICGLLQGYGPMDSFDVLPIDGRKTKIAAFAQFSTAEAAAAAAKGLHGVRQDFLRGNALWVDLVHSIKYSIPPLQFVALKSDLDQLRVSHENDCKLRYYDRVEHGQPASPVCIRIYGVDPKELGRMKVNLEALLRGRQLVLENDEVWDEYFDNEDGALFLGKLNADSRYFVKCDRRTRTLHFFGNEADFKRARDVIVLQLADLRLSRHVIPLHKDMIRTLVTGGLKALHEEMGTNIVILDVVTRTLAVRGDGDDVKRVQLALSTMNHLSRLSSTLGTNTEVACPVCFCETADPIELSCRHIYCKTCLHHFLQSATGLNFSVLRCVAENVDGELGKATLCNAAIPYDIIRNILSPLEEKNLLESSFLSHIHARPDEFRYCPTPDCNVIHRSGDKGTVLQCPSCLARVCGACHVEFHEGLTCEQYQDNLSGGLEALDKWKKENGVKPCPKCSADLEKNGGCNHITCIRCHTHICWVCMKTFVDSDSGGGVYAHMQKVHGSIFVGVCEVHARYSVQPGSSRHE